MRRRGYILGGGGARAAGRMGASAGTAKLGGAEFTEQEIYMEVTTILFDLDGTLLPMDQDVFTKTYFKLLAGKLAPLGYEPGKLVESIWAGTAAMVKNDGSCLNEEAFWRVFADIYGQAARKDRGVIDSFYTQEFNQAKAACGFHPSAARAVEVLKAAGKTVVLATNPIFPRAATESRIRWAGLEPSDFLLYTTYENAHFCKPNLRYYEEILEQIGRRPEECLMVGNDVGEDMVARQLGMEVFLLTDCLIDRTGEDLSQYRRGGFPELLELLESL